MPITINGSGTLTGLSAGGLPDSSITSDDIANGAVTASKVAAGAVVQVLSTTKTDTQSISSASYTDITGLSVTITPSSASNKILIHMHVHAAYANIGMIQIVRGSTAIGIGDAAGSRQVGTVGALNHSGDGNALWPFSMTFLDSPGTTSATTYKLQARGESATNPITINRSVTDANSATGIRTISTITVMEIVG